MRELLLEVIASIRSNKKRVILTGFSVGWGMFILIVLVGAGNGLVAGMTSNFAASGDNLVTLLPGKTSMPWNGMGINRPIKLYHEDKNLILKQVGDNVKSICCDYTTPVTVSYGKQYINLMLDGTEPGWAPIKQMQITNGRDLNTLDMASLRHTCVITDNLRSILFEPEENAVGKYIDVNGMEFLVVGVCVPDVSTNRVRTVYIPLTTALALFSPDRHVSSISILTKKLDSEEDIDSFVGNLRFSLSDVKGCSSNDKMAIQIKNVLDMFVQTHSLLAVLRVFIWIIGLATMVAGVVGISNIMLVAVDERRREFGIRLAMGASNKSIIMLVLVESIIITFFFGYIGTLCGVALTYAVSVVLSAAGSNQIFGAPTVGMDTVLAAFMIMVSAGVIAGYFPARKAVSLKITESISLTN